MIKHCPEKLNLIPDKDGIYVNKLGEGRNITSNTCNTARKVHYILVELVTGAYEYDCINHLYNV